MFQILGAANFDSHILKVLLQTINIFDLRRFLANLYQIETLAFFLGNKSLANIGNGQAKKALERRSARKLIGKTIKLSHKNYMKEKQIVYIENKLRALWMK